MKYNQLIEKTFINPNGANLIEIKSAVIPIIEDLLTHLSSSESKPLLPESFSYNFGEPILNPEPKKETEIIKSLNEVYKHSMNPYSTRYIGHMDSMPTIYSALGDFITALINNNMFALEMSPFLTNLEYKLIEEFCELFGYNKKSGGIVLGGGSLANLQALIVARNYSIKNQLGNVKDKDLVILCSEMAHVSIKKSAMILGIGSDNVIAIPEDYEGHINVDLLNNTIIETKKENRIIIAVIATAGTTVTGNIDSIDEVHLVTKKHNLWLHVDAIWGGGLILSEKYKKRLNGINKANSITFNPQKWMMVTKTCSLVLFKDKNILQKYFLIKKDYVKTHNLVTDLSEISIVGTKRAEVLKLWLSIQSIGLKGYELYVNHTMKMIEYFQAQVKKRSYLRIAFPVETAMICLRSEPELLDWNKWDAWNESLQNFLLREKNIFISLPKFKNNNWLRIILLNPFINESLIDNIFICIDEFHMDKYYKKHL